MNSGPKIRILIVSFFDIIKFAQQTKNDLISILLLRTVLYENSIRKITNPIEILILLLCAKGAFIDDE